MSIRIFYGTESGNAELAADDVAAALDGSVVVSDLAEVQVADLNLDNLHLIICSTYGDGELPASAQPFHDALTNERPDLSGLRYAIFGLGDSGYDTYNHGSETLDSLLQELGATRLGEFGRHDASGADSPGDAAAAWARSTQSLIVTAA